MAITILQNVPADQVETYKTLYKDAGATDVGVAEEPDGEFTLTITYPDRETHAARQERIAAG